jgi:hypothetical protein
VSAAREAFVQNDAQTIREALDCPITGKVKDGAYWSLQDLRELALAALDRLEELATA